MEVTEAGLRATPVGFDGMELSGGDIGRVGTLRLNFPIDWTETGDGNMERRIAVSLNQKTRYVNR